MEISMFLFVFVSSMMYLKIMKPLIFPRAFRCTALESVQNGRSGGMQFLRGTEESEYGQKREYDAVIGNWQREVHFFPKLFGSTDANDMHFHTEEEVGEFVFCTAVVLFSEDHRGRYKLRRL
jgi:hypothetical protein